MKRKSRLANITDQLGTQLWTPLGKIVNGTSGTLPETFSLLLGLTSTVENLSTCLALLASRYSKTKRNKLEPLAMQLCREVMVPLQQVVNGKAGTLADWTTKVNVIHVVLGEILAELVFLDTRFHDGKKRKCQSAKRK